MTNPTTTPTAESLQGAIARLEKDAVELERQLDAATEDTLRKETAAEDAITAALIEPSPEADTAARAAKAAATAAVEREEELRGRVAEVRRALEAAAAKLERVTKTQREQLVAAVRAKLQARRPELEQQLHQVVLELAVLAKLTGRPGVADFVVQTSLKPDDVFHQVDARLAALVEKELTNGR